MYNNFIFVFIILVNLIVNVVCQIAEAEALIRTFDTSAVNEIELLPMPKDIRKNNSYLIILENETSSDEVSKISDIVNSLNGTVVNNYSAAIKGLCVEFAGDLPLNFLEKIPVIKYIEENSMLEPTVVQTQDTGSELWGLDSLDGETLDEEYKFNLTGEGVNIYIVDTPVETGHPDFNGRAKTDYIAPGVESSCPGHGTHVASIAAGKTAGVAKKANIFSYAVLDCGGGPISEVIDAIDQIILTHQKPAVINLSLGPRTGNPGVRFASFIAALENAVENGIVVSIAMGNQNSESCAGFPASAKGAFAVASIDKSYSRSLFSNYGNCVFMFAPGGDIIAANSDGGFITKSGTSMSTPFVSGIAALHLEKDPSLTPQEVGDALQANALKGKVTENLGSPNLILQSVFDAPNPSNQSANSSSFSPVDLSSSPIELDFVEISRGYQSVTTSTFVPLLILYIISMLVV